jgi:ribonuclease E
VRNALAQIAKSTVHPHAAENAEESAAAGTTATTVVEAPVEILDIPVARAPRTSRRTSPKEAEQLLGSVLEALPEPKQPGEGRGRRGSRRASTSGVVTPPAENS